MKGLIEIYLQSLVKAQRKRAQRAEINTDTIKTALGGGAAVTTVSGVALLVVGGTALAPVVAIGCALGIVVVGAGGSRFFRTRQSTAMNAADDIARLITYLPK